MSRVAVVCATVGLVAFIAANTFLSYTGRDASALSALLNTILSGLSALVGGGAWLYSSRAAKQTNGSLDARIHNILESRGVGLVDPPTSTEGSPPDG